ncbi:MAG: YggU family protein [Spirochaetia bacterium]|nr:YggU family protein [Spirochaetia bacterium]
MLRQTPEGIELALHVLPNAPKSQIVGNHGERLKIKIKAPPVEGKANEEIVHFFSNLLCLPKNQIGFRRGEKSKSKMLLIQGLELEEVKHRLFTLPRK